MAEMKTHFISQKKSNETTTRAGPLRMLPPSRNLCSTTTYIDTDIDNDTDSGWGYSGSDELPREVQVEPVLVGDPSDWNDSHPKPALADREKLKFRPCN